MKHLTKSLIPQALLAIFWAGACAPEAPPLGHSNAALESGDIADQLRALGAQVTEQPARFPGTRFFRLQFDQPVDHDSPSGPHFKLHATLLHRSSSAPMVVYSSGYYLPGQFQSEPTALLQSNQLAIEHRFFGPSTPTGPSGREWQYLDVRQAAADHHAIITLFKALYQGPWVSTGASKGGMASVYHRRFYPNDVAATVAYVAPHSDRVDDRSYVKFVDAVLDRSPCGEAIRSLQREALLRRERLVPLLAAQAEVYSSTYDILGIDRAFEFGVLELSFYFWQYGGAQLCDSVPDPSATDEAIFAFVDSLSSYHFSYRDVAINDIFGAYFYQAATELGVSAYPEHHLRDLLRYPGEDVPANYLPFAVRRFDPRPLRDIRSWVYHEGERILFIYGENDPWSAGAFEVKPSTGSLRFFVPGGNHGARISQLPPAERDQALQALQTWIGAPVTRLAPLDASELADTYAEDPMMARRFKL